MNRTTLWCGNNVLLLCGHKTFCLLILAFPSARPSELRAFLVCTFVAVLALKHRQKSLV